MITPFGKFQYQQLPMEIKVSPNFAQSMINKKIFSELDINTYMDDIGIWSKDSFDNHMGIVDKVLEHLIRDGMKCNLFKCK